MLENLISEAFSYSKSEEMSFSLWIVFKFCLTSMFGLIIYISHSIYLNTYLRNQNNLLTAIILPPIIFIITLAISTDLFLSLGMIGALSIVRYRTPVKSQYDLALLLSLICIGITIGVNIMLGTLTFVFLVVIAPLFYFLKKRLPNFVKPESGESDKVLLIITTNENLIRTSEILKEFGNILSIDNHKGNEGSVTNCCLEFKGMDDAIKAQHSLSKKINVISSNVGYQ